MDHIVNISVIMPFHKVTSSLYDAIKSVTVQTYPVNELILVSDGCQARPRLPEISERLQKIKIIRLTENSGPAASRNAGVKASKCEVIAFIDSDDQWHKNKLENQIEVYLSEKKRKEKSIIICSVEVHEKGKLIKERHPILPDDTVEKQQLLKAPYLYLGSTALMSKNLYLTVGFQNEELRIYEDFEWQLRAIFLHEVKVLTSKKVGVKINKEHKKRDAGDLVKNGQILRNSILCVARDNPKLTTYISALVNLDIARNHLAKRDFAKFFYCLVLSLIILPRLSLRLSCFWQESKSCESSLRF